MRILAVSGSLRAVSKNTAILEAARLLAPRHVEISLYRGLDTLPHFNPDLDTADGRGGPAAVADWRTRVARADGLGRPARRIGALGACARAAHRDPENDVGEAGGGGVGGGSAPWATARCRRHRSGSGAGRSA